MDPFFLNEKIPLFFRTLNQEFISARSSALIPLKKFRFLVSKMFCGIPQKKIRHLGYGLFLKENKMAISCLRNFLFLAKKSRKKLILLIKTLQKN